jgi:hypothetical protein
MRFSPYYQVITTSRENTRDDDDDGDDHASRIVAFSSLSFSSFAHNDDLNDD